MQISRKNFFTIMGKFAFLFSIILSVNAATLPETENWNYYEDFPVSLAIQYQAYVPSANILGTFLMTDFSLVMRVPLAVTPVLQPVVQAGYVNMQRHETKINSGKEWDHRQVYTMAGMNLTNRLTPHLEIACELLLGYSFAYFYNLDLKYPLLNNLIGQCGIDIGFSPSYNWVIDFTPHIKFLYSFEELHAFDNFYWGAGISIHYRFGDDPDAPAAENKDLIIVEPVFPDIFAGMQNFYAQRPFAGITLINQKDYSLYDIEVSFFQSGYMDSPTPCGFYSGELKSGESIEVPIYALFNENIFEFEGVISNVGEIIVNYTSRNRNATQKKTVAYNIHDKTRLIWDDDDKVAAYITPADSTLKYFTSYIQNICRDYLLPGYQAPLQYAMQVYYALKELKFIYQPDIKYPFIKVKNNMMVIDTVNLPRTTIKFRGGDCDDLTVLYCSLLETMGVETGFITYPDHIAPVLNTGIETNEYYTLDPDRNMFIYYNGSLWIPLEITLVETENFLTAWQHAIKRYNDVEKKELRFTRAAQQIYTPIRLKSEKTELPAEELKNLGIKYKGEIAALKQQLISYYTEHRETAKDFLRSGHIYRKWQEYALAENAYKTALKLDNGNFYTREYLGDLCYLQKKYSEALEIYLALAKDEDKSGQVPLSAYAEIMLKTAYTYYELGDQNHYNSFRKDALRYNPELAKYFMAEIPAREKGLKGTDGGREPLIIFFKIREGENDEN